MSEAEPSLPTIPRAINPRAGRRAWAEQPVRVWMILTLLLLVGIIYVLAAELPSGLAERRMIYHGQHVNALLKDIMPWHDNTPRHRVEADGAVEERTVTLVYPGGPPEGSMRELQTARFAGKGPGDTVDIRFDPAHPEDWTDRTEPLPWGAQLAVVWLLLPMLLIALAMLVYRRQQLLRIWREGEPMVATVVESRHSPIAPRSRMIRFTIDDSADRRVHSTFFPNSAGTIQKGDQISMLALPNNPGRAIVAGLYL